MELFSHPVLPLLGGRDLQFRLEAPICRKHWPVNTNMLESVGSGFGSGLQQGWQKIRVREARSVDTMCWRKLISKR